MVAGTRLGAQRRPGCRAAGDPQVAMWLKHTWAATAGAGSAPGCPRAAGQRSCAGALARSEALPGRAPCTCGGTAPAPPRPALPAAHGERGPSAAAVRPALHWLLLTSAVWNRETPVRKFFCPLTDPGNVPGNEGPPPLRAERGVTEARVSPVPGTSARLQEHFVIPGLCSSDSRLCSSCVLHLGLAGVQLIHSGVFSFKRPH